MAASRTRDEARAEILKVFQASLDRMIPPDESVPLKGRIFADFEDQAETLGREVLPVVMQERAALDESARQDQAGRCPHCHAEQTHLERRRDSQQERQSPHGPVVLLQQAARCRSCGRSFSPSDP